MANVLKMATVADIVTLIQAGSSDRRISALSSLDRGTVAIPRWKQCPCSIWTWPNPANSQTMALHSSPATRVPNAEFAMNFLASPQIPVVF